MNRRPGNLNQCLACAYLLVNAELISIQAGGCRALPTPTTQAKSSYWDENGRQKNRLSGNPTTNYLLEYDWDGRLRKGQDGVSAKTMEAKYAPDSSVRLTKKRIYNDGSSYNHKYVVDMSGRLPVVLLVLDADSGNLILKSYIYANDEVLMQHNGNYSAAKYFYLHDRTGSVREIIDSTGDVVNHYTYKPFGEISDSTETVSNPFMFTGHWFDPEVGQYYSRARQYDPVLFRFTSSDSFKGVFEHPLSLHAYLYCQNEPVNKYDPTGLLFTPYYPKKNYNEDETWTVIQEALEDTSDWWNPKAWWDAFGLYAAEYDYSAAALLNPDYAGMTFVSGGQKMGNKQFTSYLLGYCAYYQGSPYGQQWRMMLCAFNAGNALGYADWGKYWFWGEWLHPINNRHDFKLWPFDDMNSRYFMTKGAYDANVENFRGLGAQLDRILLGAAVWTLDPLRWIDIIDYADPYRNEIY